MADENGTDAWVSYFLPPSSWYRARELKRLIRDSMYGMGMGYRYAPGFASSK